MVLTLSSTSPTLPGDYVIDVTAEGEHIKDMPRKLHIEAAPSAGNSYAEGPGLEKPNTHHEQHFTIHAVDHEGNPRTSGGDDFHVTLKGPEELHPEVKDNGDGTYGVKYTATKPGDYEVDVTYEGDHIKDMPKTVFVEASPSAANSYAEGPGLEKPNTHHEQQFTIHAVDHDGKPRTTGGDDFKVAINGPEELKPTVKDNGDGTYLVTYEATKPGDYEVDVTFEGEPIKDMPKTVAVRASPDASKTYADGPGLEKPNTHHPQEFTIHAVDHDGNPLTQGGDDFDVTLKGPEDIKPEVRDNGDGTYTVKYEAEKPGDYEVDVQFEGAHIKDMPKNLFINASPDAGKSWADGPGIEGGAPPVWQAKHEQTFTIHAVDHDGNPRKDGGDEFKVAITGPADVPAHVHDNNDGTYTVTYTPEVSGDYKADVTYEGQSIKDCPRDLKIQAAPDSSQTWAEGPGIEDGKVFDNEPTWFVIHAVDGNGAPRTTGGDKFDIKISGVYDVDHKVTDNNDGTYKVVYEVEEPGAYTVAVDYEDGAIKDSPFKINVKEGTDASKSKAAFELTVQAHDKRGNVKTFGGDKFTVALVQGGKASGNKVKAEIETFDNGDGSYTAKYTIEGEGQFKLAVKINGHHVDGSPFNQERGTGSKKK
jgi:filamin